MQRIERTATIKAPLRKVFEYLSEPNYLNRLWPELLVVEDVHRAPNGARKFRWMGEMVGVHFEGTCEDTEYKPNQRIVSEIRGGIHATVTWDFQPQGDDHTRLDLQVEYVIPTPLHSRTMYSIVEWNERDVDNMLANLREQTEIGYFVHA